MSARDEIVELFAKYGWACDTRDWALLESCFVPDVVVEYAGFGHRHNSYEELQTYLQFALDPLDATQHVFTNFIVQVNGDEGSFRSAMRAQHLRRDATGGPLFEVAGTYHVNVRRGTDGWKMTELKYAAIWWQGNAAVLEHIIADADAPMPGRPH